MKIKSIEIKWLGHATFRIKSRQAAIYTDPYILGKGAEKADIVLISHDHYDHCDRAKLKHILKKDTKIIAPACCASALPSDAKVGIVHEGNKLKIGEVIISVVPAYNTSKFRMNNIPFHPKGEGVGYLIETDGLKIYFAGDTDFIPEMKGIKADIALIPIGGTYTMNIKEAADAVNAIKPKYVFPMHYNTIPSTKANLDDFRKLVAKGIEVC
ncbi:metal-dependent hydrolase [archaeon]|nr:metal-dependent hydrolase [archaeon]